MAFRAELVEYTEPRLKAAIDRFDPNRIQGPRTGWALDDETGDFMFRLSPDVCGIYGFEERRFGYLLSRSRGIRLVVARQTVEFSSPTSVDVVWYLERIESWAGEAVDADDVTAASNAFAVVGLMLAVKGANSTRVVCEFGGV